MTPISQVASDILQAPAPVFVVDTCNLLDLFRRDEKQQRPRVGPTELQAAVDLVQLLASRPHEAHLIVPELVPREYADHANEIEQGLKRWVEFHDRNQEWLADAAALFAVPLLPSALVQTFGIHSRCRQLADDMLASATVLDRDRECLDRAIARLVDKRRPSHKKEVKDSMNLEQTLKLCRQLTDAGFVPARVFVSSNINDFAENANSSALHPELRDEFAEVGLEYFVSLQAAVGALRAREQLR